MEKRFSLEGLSVAKRESLRHLISERDRILGLSREDAVEELIRITGVNSRIRRVEAISHGSLLEEAGNT